MKEPQDNDRYSWTSHAWEKMQYYGIPESRVKRIIRFPTRTEEGIAEETVAVMQPAGTKRYSEIWVMYALAKGKKKTLKGLENFTLDTGKKIRVITAWRYPGKSPERDPIPDEIISEVRALL